jgi:hypothetical protein
MGTMSGVAVKQLHASSGDGQGPDEPHHRDVQGGASRAAVFGISDGLLTNISLILGVAGAHPADCVVRLGVRRIGRRGILDDRSEGTHPPRAGCRTQVAP